MPLTACFPCAETGFSANTEISMSEAILLPQFIPPQVDLSGYALANHTHTPASIGAASSSHSHSGYLTSGSLSGYATQYWVSQNFAPKGSGGSTGGSGSATKTFELPVTVNGYPTTLTTLGEISLSHSAGSCTLSFVDVIFPNGTTYSQSLASHGGNMSSYTSQVVSASERKLWSPGVTGSYASYGNIHGSYDGSTLKVRYESFYQTYEYSGSYGGYRYFESGSKISLKAVFS